MDSISIGVASEEEALVARGREGFLGNRCRGELLDPERTDKMLVWKNG